jgi:uncharacterized membrane protein YvbJ
MAVKCTECGASIQDDSKFCKYCGAKVVQENLKRVEVKIDNTAEIKRAEYEEKESRLRQIKMERELRKEKRRPYVIAAKVFSVVGPILFGILFMHDDPGIIGPIGIGFLFFILWMGQFINKL